MAAIATTAKKARTTVQICLPEHIYSELKDHADQQGTTLSAAGTMLIKQGLLAATTTACVNNTQASA